MKKFSILLLMPLYLGTFPALAEPGLFGNCTQDKVIKLIDAGLSKKEIVNLCSADGNKTTRRASPSAKANPAPKVNSKKNTSRKLENTLAALNGVWTLDAKCEPFSGDGAEIVVKNGKFTGWLNGGEDSLYLLGDIEKDGTVNGYGTGTWVLGEFTGKITDWQTGNGNGILIIGGEVDCEGTWVLSRKRT